MSTLGSLPPEVIEHIGFFAASHPPLGPPTSLRALLLTNRWMYNCLSPESNLVLYARIFEAKFDTRAIERRDPIRLSPTHVLQELQIRCNVLKRLKNKEGSKEETGSNDTHTFETLWAALLMLLEDDGKNRQQLLEYASVQDWIETYWFSTEGASNCGRNLTKYHWPPLNTKGALAMWILWLTLDPGRLYKSPFTSIAPTFRSYSIAAIKYRISTNEPNNRLHGPLDPLPGPAQITPFQGRQLIAPPLAPAAILGYFSYSAKVEASLPPSTTSLIPFGWNARSPVIPPCAHPSDSTEWDTLWNRMQAEPTDRSLTQYFVPGSFKGIWEGMFEYIEFSAYGRIIAGASPMAIHEGDIAGLHKQTWKMQEFHLEESNEPLEHDSPLQSYFPVGAQIAMNQEGDIEVVPPGGTRTVKYLRSGKAKGKVVDVIIFGQGHSAWGEFRLRGRIRHEDGLISLVKEYNLDNRGQWLYRGYMSGNKRGHFSGRWRDLLTDAESPGYEGGFVMSRRA